MPRPQSMKDGELKEMYDLEKIGRLRYHEALPTSEILYGRSATLYTTLTQDMTIATYFKETSMKATEISSTL